MRELFDFVNSGGMPVYSGSRAASSQKEPREGVRITEVLNGLIVTRPAKKHTELSRQEKQN